MAASKNSSTDSNSKTITKKVNDLVITVPKNTTRKIKLKRTSNLEKNQRTGEATKDTPTTSNAEVSSGHASANTTQAVCKQNAKEVTNSSVETTLESNTDKGKDKKKKRKKDKQKEKDGSDHDEITLQLSDTEKMDLLEDLEGKQFEKSSETEDSSADSDSEDESVDANKKDKDMDTNKRVLAKVSKEKSKGKVSKSNNEGFTETEKAEVIESTANENTGSENISNTSLDKETPLTKENVSDLSNNVTNTEKVVEENDEVVEKSDQKPVETCDETVKADSEVINESQNKSNNNTTETVSKDDKEIQNTKESSNDLQKNGKEIVESQEVETANTMIEAKQSDTVEKDLCNDTNNLDTEIQMETDELQAQTKTGPITTDTKGNEGNVDKRNQHEKSEGELTDRDSSEVEASEVKPDVVCISDDEVKDKKKKKKDKKCKKSKKSKKNKDFRESADGNFYTETSKTPKDEVISTQISSTDDLNRIELDESENLIEKEGASNNGIISIPDTKESCDLNPIQRESIKSDVDDDVCEILELSDDSSCYEVEEISISKEPTAEEIEALSAKIDEIERDRTMHIDESEADRRPESEDLEHVSWKDRYLKSNKVKKVLNTANILNAIRKKNLDLKKKLQESKMKSNVENEVVEEVPSNSLEEGSIQQYNMLETCNKYVDPIKDVNDDNSENQCTSLEMETTKDPVTKEMKKDAKQLLKMYKMLLKYNDITKEKDISKKKKKKKKSKDKDKIN